MKRNPIEDDTWRAPDKIIRERKIEILLKDCLYDKWRAFLFRLFPSRFK